MSLYGDPDELERIAARLRREASAIRTASADHVAAGRRAEWVSSAADGYRRRTRDQRAKVDAAATELDEAATALMAHAQTVRERIAEIARIEQAVTRWFSEQAGRARNVVEEVTDAAGAIVEKVTTLPPPWAGWPVTPQTLPTSGTAQWLEVGSFMRRVGAL